MQINNIIFGKKNKILLMIILMVITLLFTSSCSFVVKEEVTVKNNTPYTLIISDNWGDHFDTFTIGPNQTMTIKSTSTLMLINISGSTGNYRVDYKTKDGVVTIYRYLYEIQYKVSGTANQVDITLSNASGGTEQNDNVAVPHNYSYKYFNDSFVYISAQNQGTTGSVKVEIYHKDKLFKSSTSSGAYVIASASGSI